jgi:peroxiredoxin
MRKISISFLFISVLFLFINLISIKTTAQNYISEGLLKVGTKAPSFELISSNGDNIKLSDYRTKIVLLDFWYVGCKPCIKAFWDIDSLKQELGENSFVVVGMNPINRKGKINKFKDKYKYNDKVVVCRKTSIVEDYNINVYPTIYIIDREGKIAFASAGYYKDLKKKIREVIIDKSNNTSRRKFL